MRRNIFLIGLVILMASVINPLNKVKARQTEDCTIFPANAMWNTPIDSLPVNANSDLYIETIGADSGLHPDFGSGIWPPEDGGPIGIPFVILEEEPPMVDITFVQDWGVEESDPGPYPVPADAPIEGGPDSEGDRHVLVVDTVNCMLYELYYAFPQEDGSWEADSGAVWDMSTNDLRPATWTSADAAGLPIFPLLVRYDEVASGSINHAIRFTVPETRREFVWPARHYASELEDEAYPPMGQYFRLKADYDISGFSPEVQVILQAMKTYGLILADNGSAMFISGAPDERWDNDVLHEIDVVTASDFEAVDISSLMVDPDSLEAAQP